MAKLSKHLPWRFKFRIAFFKRSYEENKKRFFQIFVELLRQDESWFKEWSLIPGRGEKFVKVGPSRHTGRDTNHHGVGADPTMDDFESRQTTP